MDILFERRFELLWPTLTEIRQVLKHVLGALSVKREEVDAAGLAATEYLTNLIRHNEGSEHSIILRISQVTSREYELTIIDELKAYNLFKKNDSQWTLDSWDDDPVQLALMNAYLKDKFQVIQCENIESGWQAILTSDASILLLDHQLKNGTCEPLLEKLNKSNLKSQLSVIMLTGDDSEEVISKINRLGVDDYLIKPVQKNKILQSFERVTHRFAYLSYQTAFESTPSKIPLGNDRLAHVFGSICLGNGGDFFMPINEEGTAFVLGDMMGHGLQALKESFAIKGFISGFLATGLPYQDMLKALNNALYNQQLCKSSLVTLIICYINEDTLFWLNAGHPAPVVINQSGKVKQLNGTGPLLGLSKNHNYNLYQTSLTDIHHTLLYTDGWTDNRYVDKDEITELEKIIPSQKYTKEAFAHLLWKNSQVILSKELDDASLIIIN